MQKGATRKSRIFCFSNSHQIIPYIKKDNIFEISIDVNFDVFYYARLLFKDEILKKYISAFKVPEGEALINIYGLSKVERHEWKCDFHARIESENPYNLIKYDY